MRKMSRKIKLLKDSDERERDEEEEEQVGKGMREGKRRESGGRMRKGE